MPDDDLLARPRTLFERGMDEGYPECCVWAFSLGWSGIDAAVHIGISYRMSDDEVDALLLNALDHVPCRECIGELMEANYRRKGHP